MKKYCLHQLQFCSIRFISAVFANDGNVHTGNLITKLKQLVVTSSQTTKVVLPAVKDGSNNVNADSTKQNLKMLVNTSNQT